MGCNSTSKRAERAIPAKKSATRPSPAYGLLGGKNAGFTLGKAISSRNNLALLIIRGSTYGLAGRLSSLSDPFPKLQRSGICIETVTSLIPLFRRRDQGSSNGSFCLARRAAGKEEKGYLSPSLYTYAAPLELRRSGPGLSR